MTKEEAFDRLLTFRNEWAASSNAETDPTKMLDLAGLYISMYDEVFALAGGHPEPPPPRVHP